jgi:uncharacterized UPF0146 family protein
LETCRRIAGLADYIASKYNKAAEIGIGHFPDVADALLKRGLTVFATDIHPFYFPGFRVYADDITSPDLSIYEGTEILYSMRPPPELLPHLIKLGKMIRADIIIKPLSSEYPDGWQCVCRDDSIFFVKSNCRRQAAGIF